ncbi:MAG TPA: hypothetical protein VFP65_04870 [Anaeromyxobacteraceae bacterium]|nr:hypothetical protein [Anaeromyxobacteraceae bacterium]
MASAPGAPARPELFHRIAETASAEARRRLVERGLVGRVELRNVEFSSHAEALRARGGSGATPALWDGERLHQGGGPVLAALDRLAAAP